MLSRSQRITRGIDYRSVVRRGARRAGAVHVLHVVDTHEDRLPRFGFIVSKAVGNAVTRNTVRRGADIVIRALPASATSPFSELRHDVVGSIERKAAS